MAVRLRASARATFGDLLFCDDFPHLMLYLYFTFSGGVNRVTCLGCISIFSNVKGLRF